MGEAKRRGPREPDGDRLPHFIFGRDFDAESKGGFALAGLLVTDIGKDDRAAQERDAPLLNEIVQRLLGMVKDHPELKEAGVWRDPDDKQTNDFTMPYPEGPIKARMDRCISVAVRIDAKPSFTADGKPAVRIWADDPALR